MESAIEARQLCFGKRNLHSRAQEIEASINAARVIVFFMAAVCDPRFN
jgi:hypothetical protein